MRLWHSWIFTPTWHWGSFVNASYVVGVFLVACNLKPKSHSCALPCPFSLSRSLTVSLYHSLALSHRLTLSLSRYLFDSLTLSFYHSVCALSALVFHSVSLLVLVFRGCFFSIFHQKLLKVSLLWGFPGKGTVFYPLNVGLVWFSYGVYVFGVKVALLWSFE